MPIKIVTYNVNGIRSALNKGLYEWAAAAHIDILCLQEVKATQEQVDLSKFEAAGYHIYWHHAQKKGYSGVAILSKIEPINACIGCGSDVYDAEGRVIRLDFADFSVMNVYMPSGASGEDRQGFKLQWLEFFLSYVEQLRTQVQPMIICGDYNICHKPIDIHNPVANKNSSGFLPEERGWMSEFMERAQFIDCFRYYNKEPHHYTWWSYMPSVRQRNLGWRIDYHLMAYEMHSRLRRCVILKEAVHSDHCPVLLEIE